MGWQRIAVYDGTWFGSQDPISQPVERGEPQDELARRLLYREHRCLSS
jgi:hypothetical protein